jgi:hypothetical protein
MHPSQSLSGVLSAERALEAAGSLYALLIGIQDRTPGIDHRILVFAVALEQTSPSGRGILTRGLQGTVSITPTVQTDSDSRQGRQGTTLHTIGVYNLTHRAQGDAVVVEVLRQVDHPSSQLN